MYSMMKNSKRLEFFMQVGFFVATSLVVSASLEENSSTTYESFESRKQQDAVMITNFPRKNSTQTSRQLYLPAAAVEPDYFLPEVIDNRVRFSTAFNRALPISRAEIAGRLRGPAMSEKPLRNVLRENNVPMSNNGSTLMDFTGISGVSQLDPGSSSTFNVHVNEMACQNSGQEMFFRASMRASKDHYARPIIDGVGNRENCRLEKVNEEYRIDFEHDSFWSCGIQDCSTDRELYYCLNVRFPAIPGLRLREDRKVTLRCKTQEKTVSHVKRLNVKPLDTSGRNAPKIETGGYKNIFETEVGLYRKTFGSGHLFDVKIQPGGTVVLGEEILLRALVRGGDGWRYSRISDVTVHYVEKSERSKIMKSLWILDTNGCLNPDVREISSREQYRVSPLENYLTFEAFMFDNMKVTDEMVMNVRITGCLDGADCTLNCPAGHSRRARSLRLNSQNETIDWSNDITFRVTFPEDSPITLKSNKSFDTHLILPYILSVFVLLTIVAMLITIRVYARRSISKISSISQ